MNSFAVSVATQKEISQSIAKGNHIIILVDFEDREVFDVIHLEAKNDYDTSNADLTLMSNLGILPDPLSKKVKKSFGIVADNVKSIGNKKNA
jgi:hypothetical protein